MVLVMKVFMLILALIAVAGVPFVNKFLQENNIIDKNNIVDRISSSNSINSEEVEEIVAKYIKGHPKEIMTSLEEYQMQSYQEETKGAIKGMGNELYNPKAPRVGTEGPEIVEFIDYACGYCKKNHEVISKAMEEKKFRVVLRHLPVFGEDSQNVSKAVIAVYQIDPKKFDELHHILFSQDSTILEETGENLLRRLEGEVEKLNIDLQQYKDKVNSTEVMAVLKENLALASALGIRGTPGFVVGDNLIPGAILDAMDLKRKVEEIE